MFGVLPSDADVGPAADYRLPVLYGLIGDTDKARDAASVRVAERAARTVVEADAYRAFASALDDWLTI